MPQIDLNKYAEFVDAVNSKPSNSLTEFIDYTKRGIIVIGSARSGSHMTSNMLYNISTINNKVGVGEIYTDRYLSTNILDPLKVLESKYQGQFIFCSLTHFANKNLLAMDSSYLKDYNLVNLRRRDKVAQYISWCVFRVSNRSYANGHGPHSPKFADYKDLLPWPSTREDIEMFILEQNIDYAFSAPVLYYEDLVLSGMPTRFKKTHYPLPFEEIVTDYKLVCDTLLRYTYD